MALMSGIKINVNHGQEGLKKLPADYYYKIRADITCAASEFERSIKVEFCGAPSSTVYVTGLPRYDQLDTSPVGSTDILE